MRKVAKKKRDGNPVVSIRLPKKTIKELDRVSKSVGYSDRSAFLREFIVATVAGDLERMHSFVAKMTRRAMEQAQMTLQGLQDDDKPRPRVKGRGQRVRAT